MIPDITTEIACAVSGTPYERANQWRKRGQFRLIGDTDSARTKDWYVVDVVRLAVLRQLTEAGVSINVAADILRDDRSTWAHAWEQLGSHHGIMLDSAPQWYLVHADDGTTLTNDVATAQQLVFADRPRVAIVLDLTSIARDVRRKLEAMTTHEHRPIR